MNVLTSQHVDGTTYVVKIFYDNLPSRTWHTGTLHSCRAWIRKNIKPHQGMDLKSVGIYQKHMVCDYTLVERGDVE